MKHDDFFSFLCSSLFLGSFRYCFSYDEKKYKPFDWRYFLSIVIGIVFLLMLTPITLLVFSPLFFRVLGQGEWLIPLVTFLVWFAAFTNFVFYVRKIVKRTRYYRTIKNGDKKAVKLIAHTLIEKEGFYLVIRRTTIKRGKKNVYPCYWDIPGGGVEYLELPREAAVRECMEETGLDVTLEEVLHEDSQLDRVKQAVFTRLVYRGELVDSKQTIRLDPEEHTEFRWVKSLADLDDLVVPYLKELIPKS